MLDFKKVLSKCQTTTTEFVDLSPLGFHGNGRERAHAFENSPRDIVIFCHSCQHCSWVV